MKRDLLKVIKTLEDESANLRDDSQKDKISEFDMSERDSGVNAKSSNSDIDSGVNKEESFDEMRERLRLEILEELRQNNGGEEAK